MQDTDVHDHVFLKFGELYIVYIIDFLLIQGFSSISFVVNYFIAKIQGAVCKLIIILSLSKHCVCVHVCMHVCVCAMCLCTCDVHVDTHVCLWYIHAVVVQSDNMQDRYSF